MSSTTADQVRARRRRLSGLAFPVGLDRLEKPINTDDDALVGAEGVDGSDTLPPQNTNETGDSVRFLLRALFSWVARMNVDAGHTGGAGRSHRRIPARQPAADRLRELLYPELRRLAASKMKGERLEHTWQPTVLVNELELLRVRALREPLSKLAS